jgi:hypothetical protein
MGLFSHPKSDLIFSNLVLNYQKLKDIKSLSKLMASAVRPDGKDWSQTHLQKLFQGCTTDQCCSTWSADQAM